MQDMLLIMCFKKSTKKREKYTDRRNKYSTIILKLFSLIIRYKTLNIFFPSEIIKMYKFGILFIQIA
eukprot:GAHX01003603.1.p1 GENE.GAHX01003603.1~~GAHX01003603.1.p1  ORF type:complete len:67 (+),score=5.61 GAHX01003603.1:210-410(+)